MRPLAMGQIAYRLHDVILSWIYYFISPKLLGELQAFVTNVQGDYPRAHRLGELRRAQSDRALPENRNSFVTRKIEPL